MGVQLESLSDLIHSARFTYLPILLNGLAHLILQWRRVNSTDARNGAYDQMDVIWFVDTGLKISLSDDR